MSNFTTKVRNMDRHKFESLFTSGAFLITNGLLFVNMFLLFNGIGDDGRGAVAAAYGNTVVIGWAFQIGVPTAAGYFAKDIDNRRISMSAWAMTLLGAIPVALLLIPFFMWQLGGNAFTEGGESLQRWYIAFIILQLFNGPFLSAVFWLRGVGNLFKFNALLALPQALITLGYLGLFVTGTMTTSRALTSTFIALAIGWVVGLTATNSWPGKGFSRQVFDEVRHYSLRAWVGNLSFFVSLRIDQLLLVNFVEDLGELGVYAGAAAISTAAGPIARGWAQSLLPFVRNAKSDDERLWRITSAIRQVGLLSLVVLGIIGLTSWLIGPFLINFVFGDRVDADHLVWLLLILLPGAWATDVTQVMTTALTSFRRPEAASKAQIASGIATAIGLIALLSPYGVTGAAITTSISYWVGLIVSYFYWRRLKGQVERGEVTGHTDRIEEPVS